MADTVSSKKIEGGGGEETGLEDLQPRELSGEMSPSMQQGHEVGRYAAQALLYYNGGMPSATTSPIKVHPGYSQEPSEWNSQNHEQ